MPQFSEQADGVWIPYTPVWASSGTQPTLGNGSLTGRYCVVGRICFFKVIFQFGSTSTAGTGDYTFTLPLPAFDTEVGGSLQIEDAGTALYAGNIGRVSGTTFEGTIADSTGARRMSATLPVTWANGDDIRAHGFYEI